MIKKYVAIFIFVISAFLPLASFAQEEIISIVSMTIMPFDESLAKLSKGMTKDEVIEQIGEPLYSSGSTFMYSFDDGEYIILEFNDADKLSGAKDKNFDDLLAEYTAKVSDNNLIFIDQDEILTAIPIVTINDKVYIPIEEIVTDLKIGVNLNNEKQSLEITTNVPPPQDLELTRLEKNSGIRQMRAAVDKLLVGMLPDEVKQLIGIPTHNIGSGLSIPIYLFTGKETFIINREITDPSYTGNDSILFAVGEVISLNYEFDSGLLSVKTKGINLLKTEYPANHVGFSLFADDKELTVASPIVTINYNIYVPIEDLTEYLGVKVTFNAEKQLLEMSTIKE